METRDIAGTAPIATGALGLGCWAIGGPFGAEGVAAGWGQVDDDESIAALRRGLALGVTLFDTADVYGTGHSETILGRALGHERDNVVIATKFGNTFVEGTGRMLGADVSPASIRRACEERARLDPRARRTGHDRTRDRGARDRRDRGRSRDGAHATAGGRSTACSSPSPWAWSRSRSSSWTPAP